MNLRWKARSKPVACYNNASIFMVTLLKHTLTTISLLAATLLAGCSVLQEDKVDYRSSSKGVLLDVPPDLTALSRETRYVVPGATVTASGYQTGQSSNPSAPTAATSVGDVRIERAGTQRWLVVNRPAEQLWMPVKDFWQENGFVLTTDQQNLGIMETDWAENRAKLPQDFIRNTVGKVFENLYSTGERDKFRTRLERSSATSTEIYISHRGMVEKLLNKTDTTRWEPRTADSELEAEFLRRLMMRLGVSPEQSKALVAAATVKSTSRVATEAGVPVVQVDEGFDRAWRRVGLALDRTGFTVEDRDRAQGLYFVRYVQPSDKKDEGFFSKLFSDTKDTAPLKYRIAVKSQGESTTVSVLNATGVPETSDNAQRIVKVIADDLK
jgi:outer membrane protein assembly factor BamC